MEIKYGFIKEVLPERSGVSGNGVKWRMQDVVIAYGTAAFPHSVVVTVSGDRIDEWNLRRGIKGNFYFDSEAREYQGKWYNSIRLWKVEIGNAIEAQPNTAANVEQTTAPAAEKPADGQSAQVEAAKASDGLPF